MRYQNGGLVNKSCFPTAESTSWADDHIAITGIMGIGREKTYSLCGELGSRFMMDEWGYPDTGVYIADCPSAGHDMVMLDYSKCGKEGEPEVVHVDQEDDYKKTFLAKNFETFIKGLKDEDEFDLD
ncbi:SMI1/KNR4 family protein [Chryseobacterium soli]|nr:SMI1/KNR4 family protein [Chryseobacterium soli]